MTLLLPPAPLHFSLGGSDGVARQSCTNDADHASCEYWASNGDCELSFPESAYLLTICRLSCHVCETRAPTVSPNSWGGSPPCMTRSTHGSPPSPFSFALNPSLHDLAPDTHPQQRIMAIFGINTCGTFVPHVPQWGKFCRAAWISL